MTLTEEQIAGRSPLRLKIVEVGRSDGPPDFLIADEDVSEVSVMMGTVAVYAQVADRRTAEIIVKSVHEYPALLSALEAANKRADEAEAKVRRRGKLCLSLAQRAATARNENDALRARVAELEEQYADKVDGLESDLSSAVDVLFRRGDDEAREWIRLNYPTHYERFVARAALKGAPHDAG